MQPPKKHEDSSLPFRPATAAAQPQASISPQPGQEESSVTAQSTTTTAAYAQVQSLPRTTVALMKASCKLSVGDVDTAVLANLKLLQTGEHSDLNLECGKTRWNCHKAIVWSRCPKFADHETEMFDLHQGYEEATDVLLVWLYTLDKRYVQSVLRDHAQEKLRTTLVLLELTQVYDIKDDRFKDTILDLITEFFEKAIAALDTADGRSRTKITDIVQMLGEVFDDHMPVDWREARARILPIVGSNTLRLLRHEEFKNLLGNNRVFMTEVVHQLACT